MHFSEKKAHLLYFSPTGTTKSVLTAIAEGVGMPIEHHDITLPKGRKNIHEFTEDDLLIVGLPVYSGRIPKLIESHIQKLTGQKTPTVIVAVYGNRDIDDALVEMQDILTEGGFKPIAGAAFIGEHSLISEVAKNRPDPKDLEKASTFGKAVRKVLQSELLESIELKVRGNRPYRERKPADPIGPTIGSTCNACGECVAHCPTGALSLDGKVHVDETLCILCHSCQRRCLQKAISFGGRVPQIQTFLLENCSERKEPEVFIGTSIE